MIWVDVIQNTDAWWLEKLGKPSASNASCIVTMDGSPSKQREGYMNELAAERVTGQRDPVAFKNGYLDQGNERQEESKKLYELMHDCQVTPGGVCYPDEKKLYLCSPDGLILGSHGLEMKNPAPKTQVKYLIKKDLPSDYFSQVQMSLLITGFEFWDFMSYSPGLKPLLIRVTRNEKFIGSLKTEMERFCSELDSLSKELDGS